MVTNATMSAQDIIFRRTNLIMKVLLERALFLYDTLYNYVRITHQPEFLTSVQYTQSSMFYVIKGRPLGIMI